MFCLLQKGASAQTFFVYIVESVLPKLNELAAADGEDIKLEMLKLCAEMSPHGLTDENVKAAIEPIYNLLLVRFTVHIKQTTSLVRSVNVLPGILLLLASW